ncbi:hypothetical protein K443DRAFT_491698 [Laccaria amethystina LaAM-08-1]|uniref:Unplaced genomic scaffold K443scaffold_49, whole genome shotgun sequence n=1 Tax=Laccaria amethystina LaAM-08-1 TaxID=1095629 RepID=A0A0C9WUW7_9AGAR|nr:hypothetical protein K443DRAFT_491698 [Laccaria amethystina LaAM-08-1]
MSAQNAPRSSLTSTQAIIDAPTTGVPRQSYRYKHLTLTPLKLSGLPRGPGRKRSAKRSGKKPSLTNGTS